MNKVIVLLVLSVVLLTGCAPEVGSKKWCAAMEKKSKSDWTVNEAADFAKHCLFKIED